MSFEPPRFGSSSTTTTFPLFTSLFNDTQCRHAQPLTSEDDEFFLKHISDLDDNGREIFYAVIRQDHVLANENVCPDALPPCCKQMKKGLRVDIDKIPLHLKHMLLLFLRKYIEKQKEEATFFPT